MVKLYGLQCDERHGVVFIPLLSACAFGQILQNLLHINTDFHGMSQNALKTQEEELRSLLHTFSTWVLCQTHLNLVHICTASTRKERMSMIEITVERKTE